MCQVTVTEKLSFCISGTADGSSLELRAWSFELFCLYAAENNAAQSDTHVAQRTDESVVLFAPSAVLAPFGAICKCGGIQRRSTAQHSIASFREPVRDVECE